MLGSATPAQAITDREPTPAPSVDDRGERVDSYGVTLQVRRDGDLHVTEKITYHFGTSGTHHGIVRTIPLRRHSGSGHDRMIEIRNARVRGTDVTPDDLDVTTSGDDTVLRVGNPGVTVSGVKTYVIDYDVPGALVPLSATNALSWNAVGTQWKVPIHAVTVNVSAPVRIGSATCLHGSKGATTACAGGPPAGSTVTFTQPELSEGEGVTVEVRLPKAGMNVTPPYGARPAPFRPTALGGVLALAAAGILAAFAFLSMPRRARRLPSADVTDPPAGVSPALAGVLRGGGTAGFRHVAATIIDLATRGYLRFEETKSDTGRVGQSLVRGHRLTDELAPHEAKVIEGLLGRKGSIDRKDSIAVAAAGRRRWVPQEMIYELLETEACERGWFRRRPKDQRTRAVCLAVLLAAAAVTLLVMATAAGAAAGVPTGGLGWAALAFLATSTITCLIGRRPTRTVAGARALAEVNAYAEALRAWTGRRPRADAGLVSRVFPFAVALGQTSGWEDVFEERDGDLSWYVAAEGSGKHETAKRIKRLAGIVAAPPSENPARPRWRHRFLFLDSSRPYDHSYAAGSGMAGAWSAGGGFSGDSGGGSVGGGDGGGGGGGW